MRTPLWLLRLLPMWSYVCPKCQLNVPKNSHECPRCGERYPLPLKLPPSVLKDKKAVEDYVHKVVFPKVSPEYREYLTRFFTEIFSDGFENGDFSAWTGTQGSPAVIGSPVHHGLYSAELESGDAIYKDFTAINDANVRFYMQYSSNPSSGVTIEVGYLWNPSTNRGIRVVIKNDAGTIKWGIIVTEDDFGDYTTIAATPNPSPNTWYCVELQWRRNTLNGARLFIDGTQVAQNSGTTFNGQVSRFINERWATTYIFDCVAVADAYIGPESAGTLQTVTDSLSLSDSPLRHKALLLVSDSATLIEAFSRGKTFTLSDSLNLVDLERALKELQLHDASLLADTASTVSRILKVSESVSVAEVVQVGAGGGVKKTKLFLILGDLALQLTGD